MNFRWRKCISALCLPLAASCYHFNTCNNSICKKVNVIIDKNKDGVKIYEQITQMDSFTGCRSSCGS
jgi:hypothetical protein